MIAKTYTKLVAREGGKGGGKLPRWGEEVWKKGRKEERKIEERRGALHALNQWVGGFAVDTLTFLLVRCVVPALTRCPPARYNVQYCYPWLRQESAD